MRFLSAIVVLGLAVGASPAAELGKANFPLEIIQPRPGLDVKNRFYKAYPGLEYNVRLAVIGGVYPFTHELVKSPEGMTIDKDRGEIVWPKPAAGKAPYPVTVKVTDQEGKTAEVSWTITVTTQGFLFVDAEKGLSIMDGGKGTFDNPWKSLRDWYGVKVPEPEPAPYNTKYEDHHPGEFVYFREGEYRTFHWHDDKHPIFVSTKKAIVWLAYPGEKPKLKFSAGCITPEDVPNFYVDGFEVDLNGNGHGWGRITGDKSDHITFRKNHIYKLRGNPRQQPGHDPLERRLPFRDHPGQHFP